MKKIFGAACWLMLAGCNVVPPPQADSTRYYVLAAPEPANAGSPAEAAAKEGLRIGLRNVELPGYLKTPDIVVRRGANEIEPQDYARWGEPLDAALTRLVRAQLESAAAVARLYPEPFPLDQNRDYDVGIRILRCEGGATDRGRWVVRLTAEIEITAAADGRLVTRREFAAPKAPWDGRDFAALAARISDAADALGRAAAAALPTAAPP